MLRLARFLIPAAAVIASPAVAQDLVANGGFETGNFSGFTQVGNTGATGVSGNFGGVAPASGSFQAHFGAVGSLGGISQNIVTIPGLSYNISFDLANLSGGATAYSFDFGSTNLAAATGVNQFDYTHFIYTSTATSALTALTLQFRQDPSYFLLDNVTVTQNAGTGAVPEPATWAMLVLGFGMVGFGLRRRAKASVSVTYG